MKKQKSTATMSIFAIHSERIGLFRTFFGGLLMYTTLPLFIFCHIFIILFLYTTVLRPLLALPSLKIRDYIILDRYTYSEISFIDKINCLFCEYANGIIVLMNKEIDTIAAIGKIQNASKFLISFFVFFVTLFYIFGILLFTLPTNIFMKLLGLHRGSHKRIAKALKEKNYADTHAKITRHFILLYKISIQVIAYNLEQIESAWCPIKHLERNGYVVPKHHSKFYSREEIATVKNELATKGTVSDLLPKF